LKYNKLSLFQVVAIIISGKGIKIVNNCMALHYDFAFLATWRDNLLFSLWSILILLFIPGIEGKAQYANLLEFTEHLNLQTDRTLYVVGESIHFSALLSNRSNIQPGFDSKILYIELITPDASTLSGGKFAVSDHKSKGCLLIPKEIVSGFYYLRGYTKFMRNRGPKSYAYVLIKIINPYKPEILVSSNTIGSPVPIVLPETLTADRDHFMINCDKKICSTRESIKLTITSQPGKGISYQNLVLSVVPDSSFLLYPVVLPGIAHADTLPRYYPETLGISVTGLVNDKRTGEALPFLRVNLSIFGEQDFIAVNTDSTGRFFFSLPGLTGDREIFICTEMKPGTLPVVNIDKDFCTSEIYLPTPAFHLSETELNTALNLAMNAQIASAYLKEGFKDTLPNKYRDKSFYGKPSGVLMLDNYIQLPTLEEYFNELPGIVKIRKRNDKPYFLFSAEQSEMGIFDPLVLVDWVAVNDMESILRIPPQSISRIEFVNAPYVKGDIIYGGIVNFISKKNDFAGIDLPSAGSFINFDFLAPASCNALQNMIPESWPDSRNTIYWNPDLKIENGSSVEISITTPDTPGRYAIMLRGINQSGETDFWHTSFVVH
jgi:hypothetical protein